MALVEAEALTKAFGGVVAVNQVNLTINEGSIHSIIGPNGAGKTTLFNLLCMIVVPDSGIVRLSGKEISARRFHELARLGVGRSFQRTQLFPELSVLENVRVATGARLARGIRGFAQPVAADTTHREAIEVLDRIGLIARADDPAYTLSHGQQRALDIAIALATRPLLLLLDEPTSGMSAADSPGIVELIRRLRDEQGLTIALIEHNLDVVMSISDVVTVMNDGRVLAEGEPSAIRSNADVERAYLGQGSGA